MAFGKLAFWAADLALFYLDTEFPVFRTSYKYHWGFYYTPDSIDYAPLYGLVTLVHGRDLYLPLCIVIILK